MEDGGSRIEGAAALCGDGRLTMMRMRILDVHADASQTQALLRSSLLTPDSY
jgi:hypothetical protein